MKKLVSIFIVFVIIFLFLFIPQSIAQSNELSNLSVEINKAVVAPGDKIDISINFGQPLSSYVFDIYYDKNLLEFVSTNEGDFTIHEDRVEINWIDLSAGGVSPSSNFIVTFSAIEYNFESVQTNFAVTAKWLLDETRTINYDQILVPVNVDFVIEPNYVPYTISLDYADRIMPNIEKEMIIGIISPMGRFYDNIRLTADITGPEESTKKLLGIDNNNIEYDLVEQGLGGINGYSIGGENFVQEFHFRGLFDKDGDYTLTLKLIDIGVDEIISQSSYGLRVGEVETPIMSRTETLVDNPQEQIPLARSEENLPEVLPKTGSNTFIVVCMFLIFAIISYFLYLKNK